MLGNYLQQTTSAGDIFGCIFFGALRVKLAATFEAFANSFNPDQDRHSLPGSKPVGTLIVFVKESLAHLGRKFK